MKDLSLREAGCLWGEVPRRLACEGPGLVSILNCSARGRASGDWSPGSGTNGSLRGGNTFCTRDVDSCVQLVGISWGKVIEVVATVSCESRRANGVVATVFSGYLSAAQRSSSSPSVFTRPDVSNHST